MKTLKALFVIVLLLAYFLSFSQIDTVIWQQCFGSPQPGGDYPRAAVKFNNSYLFGITVHHEEPWISNYHGSADAWIINTDSIR